MTGTGIAEAFAHVALAAAGEPDLKSTLQRIVFGAADTVTGAEEAHIAVLDGPKARVRASTSPTVAHLGKLQYELGEGPGPTAIHARHTIRTGNLTAEHRWPHFAAQAAQLGVVSMMSLPLTTNDNRVIGSLSLYSPDPDAFDADAEHLAELFAIHAVIVLTGELDRAQLQTAVSTRDLIGMAKGILMHQHTCAADRAFAMLSDASQRANVKLRDVAAWIVNDANLQAAQPGKTPPVPTPSRPINHPAGFDGQA